MAAFWLEFMFFWAEHYAPSVWWTRGFFLWFAWNFSRVLREGTRTNARRLLGPGVTNERRDELAREMIRSFYKSVYEIGESLRESAEQLRTRIDGIEGVEHYQAARRLGKGAILVTAHLGSFELGVAALLDREQRIHVVFRRDEFPRFERLRSRLRARLGVTEAAVNEGWPVWMRLRDALAADEVVMIQGDRVMPGQRGAVVPFQTGHIRMPTGPVKLALASGAPLIPVFAVRTGLHRARIVIDEAIRVEPGREGMQAALAALARAIARQVAAHPEQWLMVEPVFCEDTDHDKRCTG